MLISYLTHLIGRLAGATHTIMDYGSSIDTADLERFIALRDGMPEDQRDSYVRSYVADAFYFARREILPIRAAKEVITEALLAIRAPDDFLPALRDAANHFGEDWFIKNGASTSDKWMHRHSYWLWYWLRMGGAVAT